MTSVTRRLPLVALACILFAIPIFLCANANALTLKVTLIAEDQITVYENSKLTEEAGTLYPGDEITYSSKGSTYTKAKVTNGTLDGKSVYVASNLLNPDAANPSFSYPRYLETSGSQKLRKTSSTSSTSYGYIPRAADMEVLGIVKNSKGTYMLKVRNVKTYTGTLNTKVKFKSKSGYTRKSNSVRAYSYLTMATTPIRVFSRPDLDAPTKNLKQPVGTRIQVYNFFDDSKWLQIKMNPEDYTNGMGYILATDPSISSYPNVNFYYETVKASSVTMRVTTSSKSKKITTFHKDDQVVILFRITIDGSTYAYTQYQQGEQTVRGWIKTQSKTSTYVA